MTEDRKKTMKRKVYTGLVMFAFAALIVISQPGAARAQWATSGSNISNTNTGNVGIGTTAPADQLEITGNLRLPATTASAGAIKIGNELLLHSFGFDNFFAGRSAGNLGVTGTENTAVGVRALQSANGQFHNTAFGFVALGALNTGDYTQNSAFGGFTLASLTSGGQNTALGFGAMNASTTGGFNTAVGNYALGSTTGTGNTQVGANTGYSAPNTTGSYNTYLGLNAGYTGNGANRNTTGSNNTYVGAFSGPGTPTQLTNATAIGYNAVVSQSNSLILGGTGTGAVKVGIGTATPAAALDVVGDINVSGNINSRYQDLAEWVPARSQMQPGTVVVLDAERSNQVMASVQAYDTRVAGVVSARPGIALGEAGKGKALVATTGRVRVMVDATQAPIHVGDLLVTSNVEGVAMKSIPVELGGVQIHRPGTIIGKALEPLEKGKGEILVLLSLQ
jgi:hypothetical protein